MTEETVNTKEADNYNDSLGNNKLKIDDMNNLKELIEKIDPENKLFRKTKMIIEEKTKTTNNNQ